MNVKNPSNIHNTSIYLKTIDMSAITLKNTYRIGDVNIKATRITLETLETREVFEKDITMEVIEIMKFILGRMLSTDTHRIGYGPTANGHFFGLTRNKEIWVLTSDGGKTVFLQNPTPTYNNEKLYGGYCYYAFEFPCKVV